MLPHRTPLLNVKASDNRHSKLHIRVQMNTGPGLKCALSEDGKVRTLTTPEGGVVVEHLDSRDDVARTYTYTIITAGPLPVATLSVQPAGAGSSIVWTGKYDAKGASDDEAKKVMDGIYKTGADNLAK